MEKPDKINAITLRAYDGSKGALLMVDFYKPADNPLVLQFKSKEYDGLFSLDHGEAIRLLEFLVNNLIPDMRREPE